MDQVTPPPLYGLDIETDTATDGLDPRIGRILAVAVASPGHGSGDRVFADPDEAALLRRLDHHLASLPPGIVVTWNGGRFDLPYLATRAGQLGVALGLQLDADPSSTDPRDALADGPGAYRATWHHHHHLDAYRVYRADVGPALQIGCGLKSVARLVGLAYVEVDAARVHELPLAQLARYVLSDARSAAALARRRWRTARLAVDPIAVTRPATVEAVA